MSVRCDGVPAAAGGGCTFRRTQAKPGSRGSTTRIVRPLRGSDRLAAARAVIRSMHISPRLYPGDRIAGLEALATVPLQSDGRLDETSTG